MPSSRRKVYPVPEIVFDDSIKIEGVDAGSGSMDNEARIMRVPLIDTPACRHVRAHEMAHAKYSPKKPICPRGVHPMIVQRVEDMRMNTLCRKQGLHAAMDAPIIEDSEMWTRLLTGQMETLTAGISTHDTGDWDMFRKRGETRMWLDPEGNDLAFIETVHEGLKANPTWHETQRQSIRVARYLRGEDPDPDTPDPSDDENSSEETGDAQETDSAASEGSEKSEGESEDSTDGNSDDSEDGESDEGESDGDGEGEDDGKPEGDPSESDIADGSPMDLTTDMLDKIVDNKLERDAKRADMSAFERGLELLEESMRDHGSRSSDAIILPAKVTEARMPQRLAPSKFKSRAKVPADRGMVPKHMNRYCTDKAIFAGRGRKRSQGGTILIDCSGSMTISSSQIDTVMNIAPLGTIASYAGTYSTDIGGEIKVIAKNGKRATGNLRPDGVMNRIDVPALEWMLKQDGPYFWVCDGHVSGASPHSTGERFGKNVYEKCIEIVEKHGIIMVPRLSKLPEVMEEVLGRK